MNCVDAGQCHGHPSGTAPHRLFVRAEVVRLVAIHFSRTPSHFGRCWQDATDSSRAPGVIPTPDPRMTNLETPAREAASAARRAAEPPADADPRRLQRLPEPDDAGTEMIEEAAELPRSRPALPLLSERLFQDRLVKGEIGDRASVRGFNLVRRAPSTTQHNAACPPSRAAPSSSEVRGMCLGRSTVELTTFDDMARAVRVGLPR